MIENINFVTVDDIRDYTAKIYCEDPYGNMIDIVEMLPDTYNKDLSVLRLLIDNSLFRGLNGVDVSIENMISHFSIDHYNHQIEKDPSYRIAIELFANTFLFDKKFKVFVYFDDYDPIINPFYGFELFSSMKEFVEVINKLPRNAHIVWHNKEELKELLDSYNGGDTEEEKRRNNIIRILIILFCKGR